MDTCFETLNHQELGLASRESPVRLRVRLSYDAHAGCPLEWDHAHQEALDSAHNHWGRITKTPESL